MQLAVVLGVRHGGGHPSLWRAARVLKSPYAQSRPKPSASISSASAAWWPELDVPMPIKLKRRRRSWVGGDGSSDASSVTRASRLMPRRSASRRRRATTSSGSSSVTGTCPRYLADSIRSPHNSARTIYLVVDGDFGASTRDFVTKVMGLTQTVAAS